jgi:hypothetical protein
MLSVFYFFISICTALSYQNELISAHMVDDIKIRFPSGAQEAQSLWQEEILLVQKKWPLSQNLSAPTSSGPIHALWLPTNSKAPLLILSSGIHGAEAFTGTTLQRLFLKNLMSRSQIKANLLIIHGINPYGFQNFRRTNSKNVDLNRNFYDSSNPIPRNDAYRAMQDLIHPRNPVSTSLAAKIWFFLRVGWYYLWNGKKEVLGVLSGQSQDAHGLYFAGATPQEETKVVQQWIEKYTLNSPLTLHIDLHTGFGKRGHLHFYGSDEFSSPEQISLLKSIFPKATIDTGHDHHFYKTHGDLVDWTWKRFPQQKIVPMVFEFGTMDSQHLWGGLNSLWISVIENQGTHYGYSSLEDEKMTQRLFEQLFNPQDFNWQQTVLEKGTQELLQSLSHLEKISN